MKFFKIFIVLTLLFVLLIPNFGFNKKRNLSTPLSKLVGHWQDSNGFHYYFTPVDQSSRIGLFIGVLPDKEKVMNFFRKRTEYSALEQLKEGRFKNEEEAKEWVEGQLQMYEKTTEILEIKKLIGIAVHCQYKVLFHIPEVKKVKITLLWSEAESVLGHFFPMEAVFYVEKNGKQMLFNGEYGEFINPLKYIDSKTSPEDK